MKTIKEAADSLFKKGSITMEEKNEIEKVAKLPDIIKAIAPAAQGIGVGLLGASVLAQMLRPIIDRVKSNISYNQLVEKTPILADKDPALIKDYFNVINTFSPKAASNPLVAGALVNKMMEFGGVDHKLVQDIASIQAGIENQNVIKDVAGAAAKSVFAEDFIPGK